MLVPPRSCVVATLGTLMLLLPLGCGRSADKPKSLDAERTAIRGSTPPADAGAKYLAAHGGDPAAIQAKMNAAGAAYQNRKK